MLPPLGRRNYDSDFAPHLGLVLASGANLAIVWTGALLSGSRLLFALAVAMTVLVTIRLGLALLYAATSRSIVRKRLAPVVLGTEAIMSTNIGLFGAFALALQIDNHLAMLALAYSLTYATGMPVRCANRPFYARLHMGLVGIPIILAALYLGTPGMLVLALTLPGLAITMDTLTQSIYSNLCNIVRISQERKDVSEQYHFLALHDGLTNLLNRDGFHHALEDLRVKYGPDQRIALLWFDLHRLRDVNEGQGYAAGDKLLCEMARRMRACTPDDAVLARFGSDEFLLAVPVASRANAEQLVNRVSDRLNRPVRLDFAVVEAGTAIGVAILGEDSATVSHLMQAANIALMQAKEEKRLSCFYVPDMSRRRAERKEMERDLRAAIMRGEMAVHFQPLIDLDTGSIRCFEALVRWTHPEKGQISPEVFIPLAEETGQIITLGNWVTAQAARAAATWPEHVKLAVNLSPTQMRAPGAALGILHALRQAGLAPSRLVLEVTESVFLEENVHARRFMDDLARTQVHFALDDFGTGYSSLSYLHRYHFDKIKIDRSFVCGPEVGAHSDAIIRAVAGMGRKLGMEIVAEGIETLEQAQSLRRAGCTLGQGFYYSRAVTAQGAQELLAREAENLNHFDIAL
ncbi:putative bifunctional diguanylate cyclase/phosphodiesterase [Aurantiacibacter suaedae]|uniref:putative bifunctional diguanylate cyclase/phosphodiesterase n=1 Tax=Aurantiacibacter suaedae TaxID=2545755 RepID=UPI0010F7A3E7|nr:bifunctional diguanylate cyclase/phosphodiesterase [Aurantiacibacter suaedae]